MRSPAARAHDRRCLLAVLALALASCTPRAPQPASVEPWPEHLQFNVAAVGWPGAKRSFQVGPGAAIWTGEVRYRFTLASEAGARVNPVAFEADGTPIAHLSVAGERDSLALEAVAVPLAPLGDSSLVLSLMLRTFSREPASGPVRVALEIDGAPGDAGVLAWDADRTERALTWNGGVPTRGEQRLGALPAAAETSVRDGRLRAVFELPAGSAVALALPLYPTASAFRPPAHAQAITRARATWRRWFESSSALHTGVRAYDALERAALVTLLTCEEQRGGTLVPMGNPFQYRDVWLRDAARVAHAFALTGQHALAAQAVRTFRSFQRPSGVLISQRGQLDGTGQALWAFEDAAARAHDPALARELLPAALAGVRWLRGQSDSTAAMGQPWPGLLPSGDPQDNELVRGPLVGNDAWGLAGVRATVRLATLSGDAAAAAECREFEQRYAQRFEQALARTNAGVGIPPTWDGRGRDWGNLSVGYPTRALPPAHPRLRTLLERVLAGGLARYGSADSLHGYLGADLAMDALLMGEGLITRRYLDSLLAHSSSTLGQAEISTRAGGFGRNLPPHSTAAATAFALVHALVAAEDADTLVLGGGLEAAAWAAGASVERQATRSGVLRADFSIDASDRATVRWSGTALPVRVRVPLDATLERVLSGGRSTSDGRWIVADAGAPQLVFTIRRSREEPR